MKLKDERTKQLLNLLDFDNGVVVILDNEQVLKLQIQKVYINNTQYIKRFAKLVKKGSFTKKYSTVFPKSNDLNTDDNFQNLQLMFKLAQLKDIDNLDFEIL